MVDSFNSKNFKGVHVCNLQLPTHPCLQLLPHFPYHRKQLKLTLLAPMRVDVIAIIDREGEGGGSSSFLSEVPVITTTGVFAHHQRDSL